MKTALAMIVGAAALLAADSARAQDGELAVEIRCLMAPVLILQTDPPPDMQSMLTTMAIHYLGRIDVRDSTLDVPAAMLKVAPHIEAVGVQDVFGSCSARFREKMASFAAVMRGAK